MSAPLRRDRATRVLVLMRGFAGLPARVATRMEALSCSDGSRFGGVPCSGLGPGPAHPARFIAARLRWRNGCLGACPVGVGFGRPFPGPTPGEPGSPHDRETSVLGRSFGNVPVFRNPGIQPAPQIFGSDWTPFGAWPWTRLSRSPRRAPARPSGCDWTASGRMLELGTSGSATVVPPAPADGSGRLS